MKQTLKFLSLFLLLSAFGPCSATNNLTSDGGGASIETPSGSDSDSDADTGDNALPVSSLPGPAAKVDESHIIAFAPATDGYVPVTGGADSAKAGNTVVVSTSEVETTTASNLTPPLRIRGGWGALIPALRAGTLEASVTRWVPSAHADSEAALTPLMELCDQEGIACCPANTDGSFECYVQANSSSALYIYQTTDGTDVSAAIEEMPNTNLLYTASVANDVSIANGTISAITNGIAVQASLTNAEWKTQGSHTNNYLSWSNDTANGETSFGTQFDFNPSMTPTCNGFGVMNANDGIHFHQMAADGTVTYEETIKRPSDATEFTKIKYTSNGNLMYAIQKSGREASIYHVFEMDGETDSPLTSSCDPSASTYDSSDIQFLKSSDGITHAKTIAFDAVTLNTDGIDKDYVLALFTDSAGRYRLRMGNYYHYTTNTFGTVVGTAGDYSGLTDLTIYYEQTEATLLGKAALLDSTNNKIWIVNYDVIKNRVNFNTNNYVEVGEHPSAMAMNDDKSEMYVVNYDDATVSVLSLLDGDTPRPTPTVTATFDLKGTYFADKSVTLHPNKIKYYNDQLIIGCEGLKGVLVVNTSDIGEN